MVSTRRGSHISPVEHGKPAIQSDASTNDTTHNTRSNKGRRVAQNDDELRVAKKRRIGSPIPEEDTVTGLLEVTHEHQDAVVDDANDVRGEERSDDHPEGAREETEDDGSSALTPGPSRPAESHEVVAKSKQAPDSMDQAYARTVSRMRIDSLPILDNLSTQMLSTMAKSSYSELLSLLANPDSEAGQSYSTARSLFNHAKRVYSTKEPFLFPPELGLTEPAHVDILRKANIATFASSLFGAGDVSLQDMNKYFLEIFVPEGGRLLKGQGSLFLDLKTQAFIASAHKDTDSQMYLVYHFFPDDLESQILAYRPGAKNMAPSETDFVKRALSRREILLKDIAMAEGVESLPNKYHWQAFLRDVLLYVNKNFDIITNQANKKLIKEPNQVVPTVETHNLSQTELENNFLVEPIMQSIPATSAEQPKHDDFVAKAARAAQIALQGHGLNMSPPAFDSSQVRVSHSPQPQHQQQPSYQEMPAFQQYQPYGLSTSAHSNDNPSDPSIPHASQTAPTQVLYERARLAATAKSSPPAPMISRNSKLNGTSPTTTPPSQRRPWTTDEENALMAGLDRVRGPHWSQILAMFGPGGTVSEALKDRNQVQLKDKARNLKLFFLKNGIEVPYYLKYVTGDLKTRAPGQMSKNEARDRERREGDEVKAHYDGVQGMMALASATAQGSGGYTEVGSAGGGNSGTGLSESAQAAFDRIMAQIPSASGDGSSSVPLDPELLSSVAVLGNSQMDGAAAGMEQEDPSLAEGET